MSFFTIIIIYCVPYRRHYSPIKQITSELFTIKAYLFKMQYVYFPEFYIAFEFLGKY